MVWCEIKPNCSDPFKIFGLSISGYNIISNILMIAIQSIRLEVSPIDAIQTSFGYHWRD